MKKKQNRLVFGILVLTVFLGVGFAVVSNVELSISGSAGAKEHEVNVHFDTNTAPTISKTGCTACSGENDVTAAITDGKTATISVSNLEKKDDYVTVTYTIKNDEPTLSAKITEDDITLSNDGGFFSVTTDLGDGKTIAANGNTTVVVTIKLDKVPIEDDDDTTDITITIAGEPVQPNA